MNSVRDRTGTKASSAAAGPQHSPAVVVYAAMVALQAAAASLVVVMVPVVVTWATAAYSQAPWTDVVRFGIGTWLLAHHAGIVIPGGHVGLVPLGLLIVPVISCWFGGVRLARGLDPNADLIREGVGRAEPRPPRPKAMGVFVFVYAGTVTAMAALVTTSDVRPLLGQAFAGAMVIVCLAGAAGMAAWVGGGAVAGLRLLVDTARIPRVIRRCFRPVLLGMGVQLTASAALLLVAVVLGRSRILELHQSLGAGLIGGIVLTLGQLLVVPNLVIWAASYTTGAGFAVGTGTGVGPGRMDLGALPALPVLGAMPASAGSGLLWLLLAVPAVGGVVTGLRVLRMPLGRNLVRLDASPTRRMVQRVPHHVRIPLVRSVVASVLMVGLWALLGWLSGGPAGPGRLATMGPRLPVLLACVAAEAGTAIVATVAIGLAVRNLTRGAPGATARIPAARTPIKTTSAPDPLNWLGEGRGGQDGRDG